MARERSRHHVIAWQDSGADDRPVTVAEMAELIDVGGEVRSVKTADADVDDAPSELAAVVAGDGDRRIEPFENGCR